MPKISMIEGERLFVEFVLENVTVPERLAISFEDGKAKVEVWVIDEEAGKRTSLETIFEVTVVREPAGDDGMKAFGEMLGKIFGEENVFVGDEHGIRPVKPGKQN